MHIYTHIYQITWFKIQIIMPNYERVLVLEDIWEEWSPIDFVAILGDFYSSSQKHDKYICYLHQSIVTDENKEGGKKEQKKGLSYFMAHAFKRQNSYNISWF